MYCRMPHAGLTLQPNGDIGLCCAAWQKMEFGHISKIDSIKEIWENDPKLLMLKEDEPYLVQQACGTCLKKSKQNLDWQWGLWNIPKNGSYRKEVGELDGKLKFLEFTTSNICNQTCITCSSYFSSKWKSVEQQILREGIPLYDWKTHEHGFGAYGYDHYRMTDSDIDKIIEILPDLRIISIKGGEPFADKNNFRILEELKKVNPSCIIKVNSNFSKIPKKFVDVLKNFECQITVSTDGINKSYEYIRSTKFKNTIDNMKMWKEEIGGKIAIASIISIYNMYDIEETCDYWEKSPYVDYCNIRGFVFNPDFVSPLSLLKEEQLDEWIYNTNQYISNMQSRKIQYNLLKHVNHKNINELEKNKVVSKFHSYTKFMNKYRKINIYDIHPQLKDI